MSERLKHFRNELTLRQPSSQASITAISHDGELTSASQRSRMSVDSISFFDTILQLNCASTDLQTELRNAQGKKSNFK